MKTIIVLGSFGSRHLIDMDRRQFWIFISLINVCWGSAVRYLDNGQLSDGPGDQNKYFIGLNKSKYCRCCICLCLPGCTINVNEDLSDAQPLIIKPRTAAFVYPKDRTGIVYLDDDQEIEIYCTSGLKVPAGIVGNSTIAKCSAGNLFAIEGTLYSFKDIACNSIPFHTTRHVGNRCFNNAKVIQVGFDLGDRFLKVFDVCHDETSEETYYAKYRLTPASQGMCSFERKKN